MRRRRRRSGGETVIFISVRGGGGGGDWEGKVYMALPPSLVLGLVFFSYNTSSLARPAMAASDGLSSAIFQ